ncbi:MAG: hypothetical protein V7724_07515 [Sediminicola sp.]
MKNKKERANGHETAIALIIGLLLRVQAKLAKWMELRTANIPPNGMYLLLLLLVLSSASYNGWVIYDSLSDRQRPVTFVNGSMGNGNHNEEYDEKKAAPSQNTIMDSMPKTEIQTQKK